MWRQTGVQPEQLKNVLQDNLQYLWGWFVELNNTRGSGMAGAQPITYAEILAWSVLTENEPSHREVRILKLLDKIACRQRDK